MDRSEIMTAHKLTPMCSVHLARAAQMRGAQNRQTVPPLDDTSSLPFLQGLDLDLSVRMRLFLVPVNSPVTVIANPSSYGLCCSA